MAVTVTPSAAIGGPPVITGVTGACAVARPKGGVAKTAIQGLVLFQP